MVADRNLLHLRAVNAEHLLEVDQVFAVIHVHCCIRETEIYVLHSQLTSGVERPFTSLLREVSNRIDICWICTS